MMICPLVFAGKRDLIVILDWNIKNLSRAFNSMNYYTVDEEYFGTNSLSLIAALSEQVAPIIVSFVTWRNVIERRLMYYDAINLLVDEFYKKYKARYTYFTTKNSVKVFLDRVCLH